MLNALLVKIKKNDFLKTSFFSVFSTFIKIVTGFLTGKVIAVYVGPIGLALIGQLSNFASIVQTFASGAINTGVTKYLAEYKGDKQAEINILSTAAAITFICSIISSLVLLIFADYFASLIFHSNQYGSIFRIFGVTIIFYAFNALLLSILNGYKEFKKFIYINIITNLIGLTFSVLLIFKYGVYGALLASVTFQSVVFIFTWIAVANSKWYQVKYFLTGINTFFLKNLSKFSLMALVSALTVPIAQIIIRGHLSNKLGMESAGIWEALNKISTTYLLLITTSLSTYYLPRLSELKDTVLLRLEIINAYKIILPVLVFTSLTLFFFRKQIILLLFSAKFLILQDLLAYQLIGDFIKIASWILAYQMHAKALIKLFIYSEIIFTISYVLLSFLFINILGLEGAVIGYLVNYILYFVFIIYNLKYIFKVNA